MMLRLLKKSEIVAAKATERQRDMNEGMKLAKRVDSLRETMADEESALEKFRRETVFAINEEIVSVTETKNSLLKEVADLEDRRRKALEPLDAAWQEVEVKQRELTDYAIMLNEDKATFEAELKAHSVEAELLETEKKRIEGERRQSIKSLAYAEECKDHAGIALKEASEAKKAAQDLKKSVLKELSERDAEVAARERDVSIKEEKAAKEWKDIEKEKVRLADQRATLERALKRTKHG